MGEPREPHESMEPRGITRHLDAYLIDCSTPGNSLSDMIVSLDHLIRKELELTLAESDRILQILETARMLPSQELRNASFEEARELFGLAPLRFLGSHIETNRTAHEAKEWYAKAISVALSLAPNHPNVQCVVSEDDWETDPTCEESDFCPLKEIRRLLTLSVIHDDADDVSYAFNPTQHIGNVQMKLTLGHEAGVISSHEKDILAHRSMVKHIHRMKDLDGTE